MRIVKTAIFALLLFNIAFTGIMLNRAWASWHVRWGDFGRAAEIEPWDWTHQVKAGAVLLATGKVAESVRYFREANRLMPFIWSPVNNLAIARAILGDLITADKMITELLILWPANPVILQNRDVVKGLMG